MDIRLIDEFRRRTNASYDEARYYLEKNNGDLLEAIIDFEREKTGYRNSRRYGRRPGRLLNGLIRVLQRLVDIKLVVTDRNFKTYNIPVLFLLLLAPFWSAIIVAAIVLRIMGFRFYFRDIPDENININNIVETLKGNMRDL